MVMLPSNIRKVSRMYIVRLDQDTGEELRAGDSKIAFSASINENYGYSSTVVTHGLETGSRVADHIIRAPRTVRVDAIVSGTPYLLTEVNLSGNNEHTIAFQEIEKLWFTKQFFKFVTGVKQYDRVAITEFSPVRDGKTHQVLRFSMALQEVFFADAQTSDFKPKKSANGRAAPTSNKGSKATKQTTVERANSSDSLFFRGIENLAGVGL